MRKIVVSEFISLDGVMESPDKWHFQFFSPEAAQFKFDELFASDALLLGRTTYEGFAAAWPTMEDDQGFADRMNSLPKYVASHRMDKADEWRNSQVLQGDFVEAITAIKAESGQDILVYGSADLVNSMLHYGLVDEIRLMIHPIVVGHGKRLFGESADSAILDLDGSELMPNGVVVQTYLPTNRTTELEPSLEPSVDSR